VSVVLMGVVANWIARLLHRYWWIAWVGLLVILQVAIEMIWNGSHEVACQFVPPGSTAVGKIEGLGEVTLKYELPR
jgi:predicted tellurium resistance membrane protein TerC